MPSLPFQSFEARPEGRSLPGTVPRRDCRGLLSPIGDNRQNMAPPIYRFMSPEWRPAIPLATTDLSCRKTVKDLACRPYAANEMTRVTIAA